LNNIPKIIGTGFLTLDIVVNGSESTPPKLQAGGSFGNVLTILSFLDYQTYPISRLADNKFTDLLIDDIENWNVNTDLILKDDKGSTPIIIHRITKNKKGEPVHRFEFRNPTNGKRLPSYRPFLSDKVNSIESLIPKSNVYYFDRANRGSIELAKLAKDKGSLIFFEPSGYGDPRYFEESIGIADIIKYSNQRLKDYKNRYKTSNAYLEIETQGSEGLLYRLNSNHWTSLQPLLVDNVVDTAGAGDWCSAGIIKTIIENGNFKNQTEEQIKLALENGQAFGAVNCLFDGARGAMYQLSPSDFLHLVKEVLNDELNSKDIKKQKVENEFSYQDLMKLFDLA